MKKDSGTTKQASPKPVSHVDVIPDKSADDAKPATSPLHTTDDRNTTAPQPTPTADTPPPAPAEAPVAPPSDSTEVPVPDPTPHPEPHYPSGADEIMRRHNLVDPQVAEAHQEEQKKAEENEDGQDQGGEGTRS